MRLIYVVFYTCILLCIIFIQLELSCAHDQIADKCTSLKLERPMFVQLLIVDPNVQLIQQKVTISHTRCILAVTYITLYQQSA